MTGEWPRQSAGRGGYVAAGVALVARLAVLAWARGRFPPAGDGVYYDTLARRLAEGHGYTWLWPDGAVTSVAHYPVGYPAILALAYRLVGAGAIAAMIVNALFGAALAFAVYRLLAPDVAVAGRASPEARARGWATAGALVVALHPALVPYSAAVMTEGIAAALVVVATACFRARARSRWIGWALGGIVLGVATLVRPQCLAFAPLLGILAPLPPAGWRTRLGSATLVTALALAVCAPWTARNCVAMHKCALVSVNGGWNLLIGTQTREGSWQPIDVPEACRTVWDEAAKDDCFGRVARAAISAAPGAWLARMPAKLAVTFDYFGAGPWYLHAANPAAFDDRAKLALGGLETVVSYVLLLAALARTAAREGPGRRLRIAIAATGAALAAVFTHGWIAYIALVAALAAFGPRWLARAPIVVPSAAITITLTAATHAVFFGAGRYGLVVVPFVTALAFLPPRPAAG